MTKTKKNNSPFFFFNTFSVLHHTVCIYSVHNETTDKRKKNMYRMDDVQFILVQMQNKELLTIC